MIMKKEFLPTKKSKSKSLFFALFLICVYAIENSPISNIISNSTFNYIIRPLIWVAMIFIMWKLPRIKPSGKLKLKGMLKYWAFNFGIIYVVISIIAGLIDGLGRSPYNHTPKGILTNIIFVGTALIGREIVRSYLVNNSTDEENYLVFILISFFMTITNIQLSRITSLTGYFDIVKFIAQYLAPEFAQNILATYLVFLGGPLISIIFLGIIQGFHWLSPILPDLKWITTALIGVLCPIFCLMSMQGIYNSTINKFKRKDKDEESPISWMITSVVSIAIIWFAVGVFPIYPSVIATGSMEPMIKPGDVILVRKIVDMEGINNLKVGDVIQFRRDSILISHRIIEVVNDEKQGLSFRTKGDNNTGIDTELVKPQDVKGTIVYTVPKIGWPTLLIKSNKDIPLDDIVF